MKQTTKVILSAITVIALCLSVISGATFALFTSETGANIAVTSGTVKVIASIDEDSLERYSMDVAQGETFENGGTAGFSSVDGVHTLTLTNITPGDKAVFKINVTNHSNVAVQYRLTWTVEGELSDALTATVDGAELASKTTQWAEWAVPADPETGDVKTLTVAIELPVDVGNAYQAKSAAVSFKVEAVQGNGAGLYSDTQYAETLEGLKDALEMVQDGGVVVLSDDIALDADSVMEIPQGKSVTIDLNGKALTGANAMGTGAVLQNNGTLTLVGGEMENTVANGDAVINNAGTLVLDDVTIIGAPIADGSFPEYAVITSGKLTVEDGTSITADRGAIATVDGADLTINGGNIAVTDTLGDRVLTAHVIYARENSVVTINDGNFAMDYQAAAGVGASVISPAGATINVYGGMFTYAGETGGQSGIFQNYMGYAKELVNVYGGVYNDATVNGNHMQHPLADGYKAELKSDGLYYVVPENATVIIVPNDSASSNPIMDAIDNNATSNVDEENVIYLGDGVYTEDLDMTLAAQPQKSDIVFKAAPGTSPVIAGTVTLGYREQGTAATMWNANITFEGITFDAATPGAHSLQVEDVKSLTLKNCTIIGDGETGIGSSRGNATGPSTIVGCTFENAGMQILGNFGTGLVIDDCTFNNSCVNVQSGNSVTVQNCTFNNTITEAHVDDSFYAIRSNDNPIYVNDCIFNIDAELSDTAADQIKWCLLWNRGTTKAWDVNGVEVNLTDAAMAQTGLMLAMTTDKYGNLVGGSVDIEGLTGSITDVASRIKGNVTVH